MVMRLLVRSGGSNCRTFAFANVLVGDGGYHVELEYISSQSTRVNMSRCRCQYVYQTS